MSAWDAVGYISLKENGKIHEGIGRQLAGLMVVFAIFRGRRRSKQIIVLDQNWPALRLRLRLKVRRCEHPTWWGWGRRPIWLVLVWWRLFVRIIVRSIWLKAIWKIAC